MNTCAECIHAEMCRWMDEVERDGCDFFDGDPWIPVSERLPEKYTYTLWCASSGYVRSDYFNGEFWEDAKKLGYEVIAWMPLPKPFEPQESED